MPWLKPTGQEGLTKARVSFTRHLADLIDAGSHPADALELASKAVKTGWSSEIGAIVVCADLAAHEVRQGMKVGEALGQYPSAFGAHVCQMADLGDRMGRLPKALRAAADTLEADLRIGFIA